MLPNVCFTPSHNYTIVNRNHSDRNQISIRDVSDNSLLFFESPHLKKLVILQNVRLRREKTTPWIFTEFAKTI